MSIEQNAEMFETGVVQLVHVDSSWTIIIISIFISVFVNRVNTFLLTDVSVSVTEITLDLIAELH